LDDHLSYIETLRPENLSYSSMWQYYLQPPIEIRLFMRYSMERSTI
jgi:hypothetical protein